MTKQEFEKILVAGTRIKIGKEYSKQQHLFLEGALITLIDLPFEYDNDLGGGIEDAPGVISEKSNDHESIYHLFGNDFEYFLDCEII